MRTGQACKAQSVAVAIAISQDAEHRVRDAAYRVTLAAVERVRGWSCVGIVVVDDRLDFLIDGLRAALYCVRGGIGLEHGARKVRQPPPLMGSPLTWR